MNTKKMSRRKFLRTGAVSSVAVIGGMTVKLPILQAQGETPKGGSPPSVLDEHERALLRSAMDEIIPAGDGMPAASEAGGMDYLDQLTVRYERVAKELRESLSALDALSKSRLNASFSTLAHGQRIEVLTAMEKQDAAAFLGLQRLVYEAYYTRPAVWKLIGYTFYPTEGMGPPVRKKWDPAVLATIRKKPRCYREV